MRRHHFTYSTSVSGGSWAGPDPNIVCARKARYRSDGHGRGGQCRHQPDRVIANARPTAPDHKAGRRTRPRSVDGWTPRTSREAGSERRSARVITAAYQAEFPGRPVVGVRRATAQTSRRNQMAAY